MTAELVQRKLPIFDLQQIKEIVKEKYNLTGGYKEQVSERDLSFRIHKSNGETFVLKISNAAEPEGVVDFQVKALAHLMEQDAQLRVPSVIPTKEGKAYDWIRSNSDNRHIIRLLSYLEGAVVENTPAALCPETFYNIGKYVGQMVKAFGNFFHPFATQNTHLWDISRVMQLRPAIQDLQNAETRELCKEVLDRAERYILPQLKKHSRWQIVHQDAHGGNVLVDPHAPTQPVGIIDFGDMGYNSILAEIVAAAETSTEGDPLDNLCEVAAGFDTSFPLKETEINLLYDAMLLRLMAGTIVVNSRKIHDVERNTHLESATYPRMLKRLYQHGREEGIRRLRDACRFPVYTPMEKEEEVFADKQGKLFKKRKDNLGEIWHFYEEAMHFARGQGAWLYTADGTAYLDAYNNVPQMGHSHPHIVQAIARQAKALNTNTRYLCDITAAYAERITKDLPEHLNNCIFVNSGSEANDLAMQIAKSLSNNKGGLVMEQSYHGCTELTTALSHQSWSHLPKEQWFPFMEPLMVPCTYRGKYANDVDAAEKYAADADRAIEALAGRGYKPAAFMIDTALCSSGVIVPPDNYFNLVAEKTKAAGGFVIADEVQAGCGRMGTFWGFRANGLKDGHVDFITMGKPVGNGHPLGVIILNSKLLDQFLKGTHPMLFSTFGGNTVACAAGMAVLDVIERENLIEHSNKTGNYFRAELRKLAKKHTLIGDVRGRGMMIGLELVTDRTTKAPAVEETAQLLELMKARRVLVGTGNPNTLKLRPMLVWDRAEVDFFIKALDKSLSILK